MDHHWTLFDQGSYNKVYLNSSFTHVLKVRLRDTDKTDDAARLIRLFNEINGHHTPKAKAVKFNNKTAWVSPFIRGEQASDTEISSALIDIYNQTGRIVVDATADKNFIKSIDGKIVCVDVGMAFYLDKREEFGLHQFKRQKSIVSLEKWEKEKMAFDIFFKKDGLKYPQTITTIKALLYLKHFHPDVFNVNFLKFKPELMCDLANAYTLNTPIENDAYLNQVQQEFTQICPQTLHYLKESCKNILRGYISSRGAIDQPTSSITSSFYITFFSNQHLTALKIECAKALISSIDSLSLETFYQKLKETLLDKHLVQGGYTRGLLRSIEHCIALIDTYHHPVSDPTFTLHFKNR